MFPALETSYGAVDGTQFVINEDIKVSETCQALQRSVNILPGFCPLLIKRISANKYFHSLKELTYKAAQSLIQTNK